MPQSTSLRRRPRITTQGKVELGKHLDIKETWRLFASHLDQRTFTDLWIQLHEKCRYPTVEVLREWEKTLEIDKDVPVAHMIEVLDGMGRTDCSSLIKTMQNEGTFLDYMPSESNPSPPASPPGPSFFPGADVSMGQPQAAYPVESSFRDWSSNETMASEASAMAYSPYQQTRANPYQANPHRQHQAQNFSRSKFSLNIKPDPQHPYHLSSNKDFNTWPQRHLFPSKGTGAVDGDDLLDDGQACYSSIQPLRSGFWDPLPTSSRDPVPDTNSGNYWFITYAHDNYRMAMKLGIALKSRQQEVDVDLPTSDFASLNEAHQQILEKFKRASHIVVLLCPEYFKAIESSNDILNTRFIFDLMMNEFRELGQRNKRFVPIADQSRDLPNLPLFRTYPQRQAEFICDVMERYMADKQVRPCVSIERTIHTFTGKRPHSPHQEGQNHSTPSPALQKKSLIPSLFSGFK